MYDKNNIYAFHVIGKKGKKRWIKRPGLYFSQSMKKDGFQIFSETLNNSLRIYGHILMLYYHSQSVQINHTFKTCSNLST